MSHTILTQSFHVLVEIFALAQLVFFVQKSVHVDDGVSKYLIKRKCKKTLNFTVEENKLILCVRPVRGGCAQRATRYHVTAILWSVERVWRTDCLCLGRSALIYLSDRRRLSGDACLLCFQ